MARRVAAFIAPPLSEQRSEARALVVGAEPGIVLVLRVAAAEFVPVGTVLPHHLRRRVERIAVAGLVVLLGNARHVGAEKFVGRRRGAPTSTVSIARRRRCERTCSSITPLPIDLPDHSAAPRRELRSRGGLLLLLWLIEDAERDASGQDHSRLLRGGSTVRAGAGAAPRHGLSLRLPFPIVVRRAAACGAVLGCHRDRLRWPPLARMRRRPRRRE